jgi:hypothetical protein
MPWSSCCTFGFQAWRRPLCMAAVYAEPQVAMDTVLSNVTKAIRLGRKVCNAIALCNDVGKQISGMGAFDQD